MIDMGVARPRAQGQAMIRTATALTTAWASLGSGPSDIQTTKVTTETSSTTGTKMPATLSARPWMGARLRWASATMLTICPSRVSLPMRSARMTKLPGPLTVPPVTLSPTVFSTGQRFAGQHGFFHVGVALCHRAIDGHLVTGNHAQEVADFHLVQRHFVIAAGRDHAARSAARG